MHPLHFTDKEMKSEQQEVRTAQQWVLLINPYTSAERRDRNSPRFYRTHRFVFQLSSSAMELCVPGSVYSAEPQVVGKW